MQNTCALGDINREEDIYKDSLKADFHLLDTGVRQYDGAGVCAHRGAGMTMRKRVFIKFHWTRMRRFS